MSLQDNTEKLPPDEMTAWIWCVNGYWRIAALMPDLSKYNFYEMRYSSEETAKAAAIDMDLLDIRLHAPEEDAVYYVNSSIGR